MKIHYNGVDYNCGLGDDGSLDTIVLVNGIEYRFDSDAAADYRTGDGEFTPAAFKRFCLEVVLPSAEDDFHGNPHAGKRQSTSVFQLLQLKMAMKLEAKGLKHSKGSATEFTRRLFGVAHLRPKVSREDLIEQAQALIDAAKAAGASLTQVFQINIEGMTYDNPLTRREAGRLMADAKHYYSFARKHHDKSFAEDYYGRATAFASAARTYGPKKLRTKLLGLSRRMEKRYDIRPPYGKIEIQAVRWFQKTYGNTYHAVRVYVNDKLIGASGQTYGYGEHYLQTAYDLLLKYGGLGFTSVDDLRKSHWDNRNKWVVNVRDEERYRDFKRFAEQDRPK